MNNVKNLFGNDEIYEQAPSVNPNKKDQEPLLEVPTNVLPKKLEGYEEVEEDLAEYKPIFSFTPHTRIRISPEWFIQNKNNGDRIIYLNGPKWDGSIREFKADLMTLRGQIIFILSKFESARNSDNTLELKILEIFYGVNERWTFFEYWNMEKRPNRDNIKRERAFLNSKGYFLPTDEKVLDDRKLLQSVFKDQYRK